MNKMNRSGSTRSKGSGFGSARPDSNDTHDLAQAHQALRSQFERGAFDAVVQAGTSLLGGQAAAISHGPLPLIIAKAMAQLGRYDEANGLLLGAIEASPDNTELRGLRAKLLAQRQQWHEAINTWHGWFPSSGPKGPSLDAVLNALINHSRQYFQKHDYLGGALVCCRYLALRTDNADVWANLGIFQTRLSHFKASEDSLAMAIKLNDTNTAFWNSLGNLYSKTARHTEAIQAFKRAIELDTSNAHAWANLGNEHHLRAEIDDAYQCSVKALELTPNAKPNLDHLTRMRRVCDFAGIEARDWLEVGMQTELINIPFASLNFLTLSENHEQNLGLKSIFGRWAKWMKEQAAMAPLAEPMTAKRGANGAPIKIGLLSADLRDHSVAKFLQPILENLDPKCFEIEAFSCYPNPDDRVQQTLRQQIPCFHDVEKLSHRNLASLIRSRHIDVLMDLTGFTNHNRAGTVCYRAAPVQIGWLGYPGTTALKDLDYLLLDQHLAPVDLDYLTEKPLIMKGSSICFGSQPEIPIHKEIPFDRNKHITFGSLNNSYKITRKVVDTWASVMGQVPNSKMHFYRREFDSELLKKNLAHAFEQRGIAPERLQMQNNYRHGRHHLDCYNDIDLSMDTFPAVGGTTTCDALWMGVPVIALQGLNIHQRVCSAILTNLGCPELIAQSHEEFVEIAAQLALDTERLRSYRQNLRKKMRSSVLCDRQAFGKNFSEAILALPQLSKSSNNSQI